MQENKKLTGETDLAFQKNQNKLDFTDFYDFFVVLQKTSEALLSEIDLVKILENIATILGQQLGAKWVNFWDFTPDKKAVYIVAHYGMDPDYMENSLKNPIPLGKGWIGRAMQLGKPFTTSDILNDPKLQELNPAWIKEIKKQGYHGLLCLPLLHKREVIGGMCLYYPEFHQFSDLELRIVTIVANHAAVAVANFKIFKELLEVRKKREEEIKELKESRIALMNILEDVEKSRVALMNILEDVEEARKIAEEERDKTQAIITNFSDGLLLFDNFNRLSLINPQAENFFEIKGEQVIGKGISELKPISGFDSLINLIGEEIREIFRKELSLPDKKNLTLEVSTIKIMRSGEKVGTLVILHDISREKLVEQMKTEFVSIAAHQLRTPLSAIKWTLRMLLDGDLGEINENQREFLEKTFVSNERMISLINDLLNVTRIEEGKYIYKTTLANLENVVESVVESYKEIIERKKLNFSLEKSTEPLPLVLIDIEKMTLVIQNLLENAIHYTPEGGSITILLKKGKEEIDFAIRDTGIGIPKEEQDRVFSKFFRSSNALRSETSGSGLGLFIAKNIIESHGGKIWFESEENKGTTFYFFLPLPKKDE